MMMTRIIRLFLFAQIALTSEEYQQCCPRVGVPYLQRIQNLSIYVPSDDITLVCCSQNPFSHQIFEFYKEDSIVHSENRDHDENCASYMFKITTQQDIGPYYCAYQVLENGSYVQSNLSNSISFKFANTPLPPSIMLVPLFSVYTTKESVRLTCAPPDGTAAKGIQIYREEKKIHEEETMESKYEISASAKNAPGKYYCKYLVEINGRSVISSPSEQVIVNVTDVPLAPSLSSEHSMYIRGEAVTLTCSFSPGYTVKEVTFYRNGELFTITNFQKRNTFAMATLDATTAAKFTCQYLAEISGRTIASDSSNEVTISTTDIPQTPSVILTPQLSVYLTEETVSITCSLPEKLTAITIQYFKDNQEIYKPKTPETMSAFILPNLSKENTGSYTCQYWLNHSGRQIYSHKSLPISITVKDIPQAPSVILTPQLPVYMTEETVSITCSLPEDLTAISTQYFKDKQEIHKPKTPNTMSTFILSDLSMENTGSYTCQYWLNLSGRQISSHSSLPISITVEEIPQSPSIDLNPLWPVYTRMDSIRIQCLPPYGSEVVHIRYFKDDKKLHTSLEELYVISSLSQEKKGNYSCCYMCNRHGRQICSKTSRSVSITVVDIPQAPYIVLDPKLPVFIKGETVSITCSLPEDSTVISIQYFKDNKDIHRSETMSSYIVSNVSLENTGQYKCQYCVNISGRQISSHASLPISITVEDPPLTPVLKLAPNLEIYLVGETLVLTCSGFVNARHNIYKDGHLLQNDFSHLIPSLQLNHNGNYTCTYNFDNKGRQMESPRSQTVNVYVIEPLPAPNLTLGGPIVKVEDGFKVTLNCSAPDDDALRTFYYFSANEENDVTNLTAFSASFELELGDISHISYICEYEEDVSSRKIKSRRSQTLYIQLSGASLMSPPVIAGIIGVVSVLLCFALALWFYMKSKKYNRNNRFRFSWYWKENRPPKKYPSPRPTSPVKKPDETIQVLDITGEGSGNTPCLSIATRKEADAPEKAMNFSTFQSGNVSEGECAWNSSAL